MENLPPCTCGDHPRKVDPACPLTAYVDARSELTPAERADLRIIRGRAMMDRGDIAPMTFVSYRSVPTNGRAGAAFATTARVIPWLEALNMEVD